MVEFYRESSSLRWAIVPFFITLQTDDKILRPINVHHGLLQICEFIASTSYVINIRKRR